jgi:hypothetical protein
MIPAGGFFDPFLFVGVGGLRTEFGDGDVGRFRGESTEFALSPGLGVRIPLGNILEVRADGTDVIVFDGRTGAGGEEETTHNFKFSLGLNLAF